MVSRFSLTFIFIFLVCISFSQELIKVSQGELATLPDWAKEMYSQKPNVLKVDKLYKDYYSSHPFQKTTHTQQYKHWRHAIGINITAEGYASLPTASEKVEEDKAYRNRIQDQNAKLLSPASGSWQPIGPMQTYDASGNPVAIQANIHCIDESPSSPNILYCGTEPDEVFKSTNSGTSWVSMGMNYDFQGVDAIEIDPTNPNIVYTGGPSIWKTIDGGITWTNLYSVPNLNIYEITINTLSTNIVLAAGQAGLFRSTNGGTSWSQIFTDACYDLKHNTANANIVYLVKDNPGLIKTEFFISNDAGATWTVQTSGWYTSSDPNRTAMGAKIGVTPSDPNRIYVQLIGESKLGDNGFIGFYRSNTGGTTWTLPNGPDGGPYTNAHPNLATSGPITGYQQGLYNCAIVVSKTNPDSVLIGGINVWKTGDGGLTYNPVGGWIGPFNMHVDQQDFRAGANGYWVACDGGIYYSPDFFTTTFPVKMAGIRAEDLWGFGNGWNEDVVVTSSYHNGVQAFYQNYPAGSFINLAGGEPATGYVNPCLTREIYGSYISKTVLPTTIGGPVTSSPWGMTPNEAYSPVYSSEVEFHPNLYNTNYLGKDHQLWKSTDDGTTYTLLYSFGTNTVFPVRQFEISRRNPQVMYVTQQISTGGGLWKTTNGGTTWTSITIPSGNNYNMLLTIDPKNENNVWIAYSGGSNGNKIYKSTNGGAAWTNITTSMLDNQLIYSMFMYGGTDGGIYCCSEQTVYYRNNTMSNWVTFNTGLPFRFTTNIAKPFYKQSKVRSASYGKGVWESPLYEPPQKPVAQISVDKLNYQIICTNDSFHFKDYSMLNHSGATWQWTFAGASPATSTLMNQSVLYSGPGVFLVTLKVTDATSAFDIDSLYITITSPVIPTIVSEGFQSIFPPAGWFLYDQLSDGCWFQTNTAGGYGLSTQCSMFDNFGLDSQGSSDDMRFRLDLSTATKAMLKFDVAYARWDNTTYDRLDVLVSLNCGLTFATLYSKTSSSLATAPDNTNAFVPTATQWRTDSINLSAYLGQPNVLIAMRNIGNWANNLYIDNINLNNLPLNSHELNLVSNELTVFPNPVQSGSSIFISYYKKENFEIKISDITGKLITDKKITNNEVQIPASLAPGTYFYFITGETIMKKGKIIVVGDRK